jgi:hypothetical protein
MNTAKPSARRPRAPRRSVDTDLGFTWGLANSLLLGLGVASLVAGYLALARGSSTLAPILLVGGYCGFIPASLLWRGRGVESGE